MTAAAATAKSSPKATELRLARLREKAQPSMLGQTTEGYGEVLRLPLESVIPSPDNPRKSFPEDSLRELADSILAGGLIQPIVVLEATPSTYEIVDGERRWRAAAIAKLTHIPAVLSSTFGSLEAQAARLVANVQREDLAPIDKARAFQQLLEVCGTQTEAARRVGISQSRFAHALSLLKLPESVQAELSAGRLTAAHGEALARWAAFPDFATALTAIAVEAQPPISARELAQPFNFDGVMDDDRFDELYDPVGYDVVERANCAECPWKAFTPGDYHGGWCVKPEHAKEIRLLLNQEHHAAANERRAAQDQHVQAARELVAGRASATVDGKPALPRYADLPPNAVKILKWANPVPPPCEAGTCECAGQVDYYGTPERCCTSPGKLTALGTRLAKARSAENKRRHDQALALLLEAIHVSVRVGSRELAVLGHALGDKGNNYHPNGTRWSEISKVAGLPVPTGADQIGRPATAEVLADVEDPSALARALVETVLRQDLAMRFHAEGGATYGALAEWYVGEKLPERTPNDWQPAKQVVS
ncbi:MAG TPA: ParB/RepB/Spo0J family partition protein [Chloroflexota bacterium]|nr:ParB/RepB/Spo0J family partition protein [Chloroflexota bacterium]